MLIRKLCRFISEFGLLFARLLWIIYYTDTSRIYALPAQPTHFKTLWDLYLMNNLRYLGVNITLQFSEDPCFDSAFNEYLSQVMEFLSYNNEPNLYTNMQIIVKLVDGKLYRYKEYDFYNEEGKYEMVPKLEDEWIIIHNNIKHTSNKKKMTIESSSPQFENLSVQEITQILDDWYAKEANQYKVENQSKINQTNNEEKHQQEIKEKQQQQEAKKKEKYDKNTEEKK